MSLHIELCLACLGSISYILWLSVVMAPFNRARAQLSFTAESAINESSVWMACIEFAAPIFSSQGFRPLCQQSFQFNIGFAANPDRGKVSDRSAFKSPETKH